MIEKLALASLTNAQHVAFHHAVQTQIDDCPAEDLHVSTSLFADYKRRISQLQDCVKRTTGSSLTPKLQEQDEKRDRYFKAVRNALGNARYCKRFDSTNIFDIIQKKLLTPYPGSITEMPYQKETALLRGFIYDCRSHLTGTQLELLGVKEDLLALETANNSFENLYLSRISELSAYQKGETLRLRSEVDRLYSLICATIDYVSLQELNDNDTDAADCADYAAQYTLTLNTLIEKTRLEAKLSGSNSSDNDEDKDSDKEPSEDAKPSDTPSDNGGNGSGSNSGEGNGSGNTNPYPGGFGDDL